MLKRPTNLENLFNASCGSCGGERLNWRVQRVGDAAESADLTFTWVCRDCGSGWKETIAMADLPLREPNT